MYHRTPVIRMEGVPSQSDPSPATASGADCKEVMAFAMEERAMNDLEAALSVTISILALLVVAVGLAGIVIWELRRIIDIWNRRGRW
jgi:hypothetical protein